MYKHALRDVTNEMNVIKKQCIRAEKVVSSLEKACKSAHSDCVNFEELVENTLLKALKNTSLCSIETTSQ